MRDEHHDPDLGSDASVDELWRTPERAKISTLLKEVKGREVDVPRGRIWEAMFCFEGGVGRRRLEGEGGR